ncbi:MAG TPA: ABC transporter ATP-binding protein [Eoetvoesiella sp.]|uniref:ABC transporter ATP-binding protein n=1 Tax=Eoetvoesiella sp. TaxID=1966355 RepID=UPI002B5D9DB0|nr:ABC transporter ATP-binding protein [Eoetvoesiella sp.]HWK60861.1 ABC transporter ATP-binding protein [Eoetvoesiella sp.]
MSGEILMRVSGLCAGYGSIPILRQISFQIGEGEIVGVLGHNGMGKTTLMKALAGLLPVTDGQLLMCGRDVAHAAPHVRAHQGLGYVPQGRDIFGSLTVRENLAIGAAAAGLNRERAIERSVSDFPVLERLLDRKGGALSGGEQQILALARALCGEPKVLLLDEPTEGIQPSIVEEIEDHLLRQAQEKSLAVVVVEQDVGFIGAIASRVLWLQKGEIVKELLPGQLLDPDTVDEFIGLEGTQA